MSVKVNEAKWKNDLVKVVWAYARSSGVVIVDPNRSDAGREMLPPILSALISDIRFRCDRCGMPGHLSEQTLERVVWRAVGAAVPYMLEHEKFETKDKLVKTLQAFFRNDVSMVYPGAGLDPYQCCWVQTETEDYCPHYCINCHHELQRQRPHSTTSV